MPIRQSFPFQKITGTLKLIFLFYLKTPSFVFKRKFPEIKNVYTFFDFDKEKFKTILSFSSFLAQKTKTFRLMQT